MTFAGIPATIEYGGTFFVTNAPAATIAPLETVTPFKIVAPVPTQTSFSIIMGKSSSGSLSLI